MNTDVYVNMETFKIFKSKASGGWKAMVHLQYFTDEDEKVEEVHRKGKTKHEAMTNLMRSVQIRTKRLIVRLNKKED